METPQVFSRELIIRAYTRVQRAGVRITDDVQAIERIKASVTLLDNPLPNLKLTTPADLAYAEFLLSHAIESRPQRA
jgi:2-C-methyl-D-erythritol 4-phosphate cytidylyltransferase